MLKVNEIFHSIQGESIYAGLPFVFVRLARCNLRCQYCDTEYAFFEGKEMTIFQIIDQIEKYRCNYVEITGGEPLLQEDTVNLAEELVNLNKILLVETNGSLDISVLKKPVIRIVDIKTPGSGEEGNFLISNLDDLRVSDNVKFVLTDKFDFDWAVDFVQKYQLWRKCPVLFSPVFGKVDFEQLAEWIKNSGLPIRLQLQLHKIIWKEERRGV
jgi:7-carboxy-7-deazaguanine synthase